MSPEISECPGKGQCTIAHSPEPWGVVIQSQASEVLLGRPKHPGLHSMSQPLEGLPSKGVTLTGADRGLQPHSPPPGTRPSLLEGGTCGICMHVSSAPPGSPRSQLVLCPTGPLGRGRPLSPLWQLAAGHVDMSFPPLLPNPPSCSAPAPPS